MVEFLFSLHTITVKKAAALAAYVLRATTKKSRQDCIRWPGLRIFWPRNDMAPLLRWRLHLMTCLTTLVTWKWPGCLDVLSPPLVFRKKVSRFWVYWVKALSLLSVVSTVCSKRTLVGMQGADLEENIWGKAKTLKTVFSRRAENTGQNYQINHSNPPKTPPL